NIKSLENQCLLGLTRNAEAGQAELEHTLHTSNSQFANYLVNLESTLVPGKNYILLAIYGQESYCDELAAWYREWFSVLEQDVSEFWIYLGPDRDGNQGDIQANDQNDNTDDGNSGTPESTYFTTRAHRPRHPTPPIGRGWTIQAPCAAYFWCHESGKVELKLGQDNAVSLFVDVSQNSLDDYAVPEGVHRLKFFKGMKTRRKIDGRLYSDERIHDSPDVHDLSQHGQAVKKWAFELIREKYVGKPDDFEDFVEV
ncbi:MAG: hypothetical protein MI864_20095, partial [Pseudomonadales bacterium]|nr:hypothetical protein [Pseudomonadales bacterium]